MNYSQLFSDTICAPATNAGGAIGVIRISGKDAIVITNKIFRPQGKRPFSEAKTATIHYGNIIGNAGDTIDEVLISVFRAPHSYTGEDSTEISCHGSRYVIQQILQLLVENGCRQAQPGEFTQRAYLNGKMDLSQAEAVADLVASTNRATHKMAISQLKGHFSSELSKLRDQLLKITSLLELELDFSDHEELEFADRGELSKLAEQIERRINSLARSFKIGNALKKGIPVAIAGKTNVGKSTLLNQLLEEDKAIVSDIDGTTRDIIEDTTEIHGITFRFIDTAGLRSTDNKVEQMGIERTYQALDKATVVVWLLDKQPGKKEIAEIQKLTEKKKLIVAVNKTDLMRQDLDLPFDRIIKISAKYNRNVNQLKESIFEATNLHEITENDVIVTGARHYNDLLRAQETIKRVIDGLKKGISGDLLAEDLRICLQQLGEITGNTITSQEVLNNIFEHFCIGK